MIGEREWCGTGGGVAKGRLWEVVVEFPVPAWSSRVRRERLEAIDDIIPDICFISLLRAERTSVDSN